MDRMTRHLTDLDGYPTSTLTLMVAGYDRLVAAHVTDSRYAAMVAYWMVARDATVRVLASRPAPSYSPLIYVGGSWS